MRNTKRWMALLLATVMSVGGLIGCGNQETPPKETEDVQAEKADITETESEADEEDPFLTGEKPELHVLYYNLTYDMNADVAKAIMEEVTGYNVVYHNLPAENTTEKLMLEIASGADYDLIYRMSSSDFSLLADKNALTNLTPLLEKYGQNILNNVSELTWDAVKDKNGNILGIPLAAADPAADEFQGNLSGGIAFRSDALEDLGMEIPATLEEFYEVLKAYKEKTGNAPFTMARGGWVTDIMSAFGMGGSEWYDVSGTQTHRVRMDGFKDYVAFMQMLYQEGLLDNDMPINAGENALEKFTSNTALCTPIFFWDIPSIKEALAVSNPEAKCVFATCLAKDENSSGFLSSVNGATEVSLVPKNAKNPEHAVIWYNIISDIDNFKRIYVGEENVSYEIKDGNYYPIFPAFDEYLNSDKYTGTVPYVERQQEWQARARKTPEMAEAFDQMNKHINDYDFYISCEGFVTGSTAITEYMPALQGAINDILIKGIAEGTDAQAVVDEALETWEREGGLECEKDMQAWYDENKELIGQ